MMIENEYRNTCRNVWPRRAVALAIAGVLLFALVRDAPALAFDDAPPWLRQAAQQRATLPAQKVSATTLLSEQSI